MVTSIPMNPPWDQGDKNLAYSLARGLPHIQFRIMTARGGELPCGRNLDIEPFFPHRKPSLLDKAQVFRSLLTYKGRVSAYHLIFRPYPLASWMFRQAPVFHRAPVVQTVPATADGKSLNHSLFFGDRIVTLSESGTNALRARGVKNIQHIPPGIDLDSWRDLKAMGFVWRQKMDVADSPLVLFPGHYGKGQGAEMMLAAIPRLLALIPQVKIIFACRIRSVNDQRVERSIQEQLSVMDLSHAVRFFNNVSDMKSLIAASDIIALPLESMREKLDIPITLLEGMAARKPLVITDLSPMNEIITRHQSTPPGISIPSGNAEALSDALARLFLDPKLYDEMGNAGEALTREHYDIRKIAKQYEELYMELIDDHR